MGPERPWHGVQSQVAKGTLGWKGAQRGLQGLLKGEPDTGGQRGWVHWGGSRSRAQMGQ